VRMIETEELARSVAAELEVVMAGRGIESIDSKT
jgi:hypothetical protein